MSGDATVMERILRALERGPLYEGVLPAIVGTSPAHARRVLRHLQTAGHVARDLPDNPQTWKLAKP
jgi:DNA-binding IclR family transcriptional regulator